MKRQVIVILAFVLLFSGCDALKSLYGEIYGEDGGSDNGSNSGGNNGPDSDGNSGRRGDDGIRNVSVAYEGVTVDGEGTTTLVSLVFDRDIPGLSEGDVTVLDPDGTGAVKGVLSAKGLEGIYTLGIAGVKAAGEIAIRVDKNGWDITPSTRPAQVYYDPVAVPVTFVNIMPDGMAGLQTTTELTLRFNQTIDGLGVDNITLWPGSTGAVKGSLSNTGGGTYTLGLGNIVAAGEVAVTVVKDGWTINPATISVAVNCYSSAVFSSVTANGTAGSVTTTALTLTFDKTIDGLVAGDITVETGFTGAVKGSISPAGPAGVYTLGLDHVLAEGQVTVTVVKSGWNISPAAPSMAAAVHYYPAALATGGIITYDPATGTPVWEIHTFDTPGTDTLAFSPGIGSVIADYLIVAGGGGSGGDNGTTGGTDYSGGGGAGGLMYKTQVYLPLVGGTVQITVGTGGAGGTQGQRGANGLNSSIGTIVVPGGGGGGAGNALPGNPGGSGGGGGSGQSASYGGGGQRSSTDPDILGYAGGYGAGGGPAPNNGGNLDGGGGGGGAAGAGNPGRRDGAVVNGGIPWNATNAGASWIVNATKTTDAPAGTNEFSRGGNGGGTNAPVGGKAGENYGDGGSAGKNTQPPGAAGHSGIVVIRFQRAAVAP
jgi:hypothetical protein